MPIKDKDTPITIKSTDGTALEARVFLPATAKIGAVVAHPYGPLGGDLHNNLVSALTAHLASLGIATLRFNFRGVGNSHGRTSWTAKAEEGDFEACARYLIERDVERVVLVGYSFGAIIASSFASSLGPNLLGLVSISYPYSVMWFLTSFNSSHFLNNLAQCDVPKLFLIGSRDNFTGVGSFKRLVQGYVKDPKKVEVIDGADHFWFGEEGKVCAVVDGWMRELGVL